MSTDAEIREVVEAFVQQLRCLLQRAALESVEGILDRGRLLGVPKPRSNGVSPKRSRQAIVGLAERLHRYITNNPGERIGRIRVALGVSTKDLALPIMILSAENRLVTEGRRRETNYFAR